MKFEKVAFGELRATMARYGHTILTLSTLMGVTTTYLCNRLNGRVKFSCEDMQKISEIYEMPMDVLFN